MDIKIRGLGIFHHSNGTSTYSVSYTLNGAIRTRDFIDYSEHLTLDEIKEKIERLETVTSQNEMFIKPPLGVMPNDIWEKQRIRELTRALYEYTHSGIYKDFLSKWSEELTGLLKENVKEGAS